MKICNFAKMDESITHGATVVSADDRHLTVEVFPDGHNCKGCSIASLCNVRTGSRLTLRVANASRRFRRGQKVTLRASGRSRLKAIVLLLAVPTLLIIISAAIMAALGSSEESMAAASLVSGTLYFTLLYATRRHAATSVNWTVE